MGAFDEAAPSGDLHQIQIKLSGEGQRFRQRPDPELKAIGVHQTYVSGTDAVVDPGLTGGRGGGDAASLPSLWTRVSPESLAEARPLPVASMTEPP